jgi:hypothetical protein
MYKGILLAASLVLTSATAFAQSPPGGVDRSLGNGNVESQAPWLRNPRSAAPTRSPYAGGIDGTLGNGNVESQALWVEDPESTSSIRPRSRHDGGIDGTFGNGNVPSQAPWIR